MIKILCALVSFFILANAHAQVLTREWVSYFGGQLTNPFQIIYEPKNNCIYVLGATADDTGIATIGAYKEDFGDIDPPAYPFDLALWNSDFFLSKFSLDGTLLWSTYLGGEGVEFYGSLVCDNSGNIYVSGSTTSTEGIATIDGHQPFKDEESTANFLMKFSPTSELLWGTYYAENFLDFSSEVVVVVDSSNNVYLIGTTLVDEGIATPGTFQPNRADSADMYVVKFDSLGTRLWGTYVGGDGNDMGMGAIIERRLFGDLLVGGFTTSAGLGTVGTFLPTYPGAISSYLIKLNSEDGTRIWGTYIGAESSMHPFLVTSIDIDSNGNSYLYGYDPGSEGLATEGVHQDTFGGGSRDAMLMKFSPIGERIWGSFFGGEQDEFLNINFAGIGTQSINSQVRVSEDGARIYIYGYTQSLTGIETEICGYEPTTPNQKGFIAEFNADGELNWGTYYDEQINSIDIAEGNGKATDIYFATRTNIPGLGTAGTHRPEYNEDLYSSGLVGKFTVSCPEMEADLEFLGTALEGSDYFQSYIWHHNGEPVATTSSPNYLPGADTSGYYYYIGKACGCEYMSDTFFFDPLSVSDATFQNQIEVYPNPTVDGRIIISSGDIQFTNPSIRLIDLLGRTVQMQILSGKLSEIQMDVKDLSEGVYMIEIFSEGKTYRAKLLKRK